MLFIILGIIASILIIGGGFFYFRKKTPLPEISEPIPTPAAPVIPPAEAVVTFGERLRKGLSRSREQVWGKIESILSGNKLDEEALMEIEELLYSSDLGPKLVNELIEKLQKQVKSNEQDFTQLKDFMFSYLHEKMSSTQSNSPIELFNFNSDEKREKPICIMIVGVNGAGKTTTIGKLATRLSRQGAKVFVGACDTFRAAAVDQLQVWCDRAKATMIRAKENADPSGVAFETLQMAIKEKADYCLLDTAGRLHTKANLMEELKKGKRVLEKLDPSSPQHVLLVVDAVTGQNAMRQAQEFHKTLGLTGLIFTKCDGSSKAGSAVGIVDELKIPIHYIGVGETVEDLDRFCLDDYLNALLNRN